MRKMNKNMALIFMLIGMVWCQDVAYSSNKSCLRVPVNSDRLATLVSEGQSNPFMENLLNRRQESRGDRELIEEFLNRDHPFKVEIFTRIDGLSDEEIERRTNQCLSTNENEDDSTGFGLGYHAFSHHSKTYLTTRQLFLHPRPGALDLIQVLMTGIGLCSSPQAITEFAEREGDGCAKARIESYYLLIKDLKRLSNKSDLILVQKEDLDELESSMRDFSGLIQGGYATRMIVNFLSLADFIIPVNTPQKQESLKNLLILIDRLQESEEWNSVFTLPENKAKIQNIRAHLASNGELFLEGLRQSL